MARREPLITHVDAAESSWIKAQAEKAGMTVSSYIRQVLIKHHDSTEPPPAATV